jgi:aromatic-L-amino-acid decarboxylase
MRERAYNWQGNAKGLSKLPQLRVYCSNDVHTSVDRALWMSGIGSDNLVRVPPKGPRRGMDTDWLEAAISADKANGLVPAGIIACVGSTSVGSADDIAAVAAVAGRHNLYLHVDAAWAGSAMVCPEFRHLWQGIDGADSIVINLPKWLGAHHECSIHFVRDPASLIQTFAIHPEYLKTYGKDDVVNYSEWSIGLSRRFRALKVWFHLRSNGLEALRTMIRGHVAWSEKLADRLAKEPDFRITHGPILSLFAFRHEPLGVSDLNAHNLALINAINDDGRIYLTQTRIDGELLIRCQFGSIEMREADLEIAFDAITGIARSAS